MPKVGSFYESYRANEFVVEIDSVQSPSISKISGLSEGEFETIEQPDGGSNHVYKIAGTRVKFEPIVLERYMDGSEDDALFRDWFREMFDVNRNAQTGSSTRRNGMIKKLHNGEAVQTFSFEGAWIKSSKFGDLEAGSNETWKQTITLEVDRLRWEDPPEG